MVCPGKMIFMENFVFFTVHERFVIRRSPRLFRHTKRHKFHVYERSERDLRNRGLRQRFLRDLFKQSVQTFKRVRKCSRTREREREKLTFFHSFIHSFRSYLAKSPSSWIDDYFDWLSNSNSCCKEFKVNSSFCPHQREEGCQSCQIHLADWRPTKNDFKKYLPYFLNDNPDVNCVKGGHPLYSTVWFSLLHSLFHSLFHFYKYLKRKEKNNL